MKSFREQMNQMALWFTQWNVSEQTIALYALLARVSAEQSRFLSLLLENNLKAKSGALADMDETERQANDPGKREKKNPNAEEQRNEQTKKRTN